MGQFDGLKEFDVTALGRNVAATTGKPRELPVARIECDPDNIRKSFDQAAVIQLAETIKADGLLQAITVRRNPQKRDYFLISYGERRYRAVCLLGLPTIAAVIDDHFDPYRQAIENLQREDLDPLDIADWIQKREDAGDSRVTIAKRLGKPKSYVSELAQLGKAPAAIREAFRQRRIPDIRTAYLLARRYEEDPDGTTQWLKSDAPITREGVNQTRASINRVDKNAPTSTGQRLIAARAGTWNSLAVQVAGREGTMALIPGERASLATVQFADGSKEAVALSQIKLKAWMTL
jgi:ParB family chromosome partitioning protein